MINHVILEGRLTTDPITFVTPNKKRSGCKFTLACNRSGYGKGVDYLTCQCWGTIADNLVRYKHKGGHVMVIGSMMAVKYEDWKRDDIFATIVNVSYVEYLDDDVKIKARQADDFFAEYPQIHKLYKDYVKEKKKEKKNNELNSEQQG